MSKDPKEEAVSTTPPHLKAVPDTPGEFNKDGDGEPDVAYQIKVNNMKRVYKQAGKPWPPENKDALPQPNDKETSGEVDHGQPTPPREEEHSDPKIERDIADEDWRPPLNSRGEPSPVKEKDK